MRRRALLLALVAGGLAAGASVAFGAPPALERVSAHTAASARSELADVPASTVVTRGRDALGRDHDVRRGADAVLAAALALVLAGGVFLRRERDALARLALAAGGHRPRAPPFGMPMTVHC